jgi:hypothetical protein
MSSGGAAEPAPDGHASHRCTAYVHTAAGPGAAAATDLGPARAGVAALFEACAPAAGGSGGLFGPAVAMPWAAPLLDRAIG